ncbi:MAG TPA: flagellar protein FlaG [Bryobacteraceae bacterium]|nr:flagellar protein FlaG [Bryobacteraceae bacterium]
MDVSSISNLSVPSAPIDHASPPPATADQRALIRAVRAVNAAELFGQDNELTFVLDRAARRVLVRIIDKNTGELVQQLPAEAIVQMAEELNGK